MSQEVQEETSQIDENDVNVFRQVNTREASLSRGRPLINILYDRSIHGPNRVGGVKKSSLKNNIDSALQASPSSVILPSTSRDSKDDYGDVDSLSEILGEDNESYVDIVSANNRTGSTLPIAQRDGETNNRSGTALITGNITPTNAPNVRLKINAYPTNISNEIKFFGEHSAVTNFQADYLSLEHMQQIHNPNSRHESFRRRSHPDENETAVSTISVAFSPDGRTVASTHGDHTVKISCCNTGALIRSLQGHPRTPWTVKYHPSKSNIVASGCLGHQVRIWDWNHPKSGQLPADEYETDDKYNYHERTGVCLKMIRLRNSIISLSFHPTGPVLAVACGHTLHLWVYDNKKENNTDNAEDESTSQNDNNAGAQTVLHQIRYANNLRCVHFPPGGDTIIIGGLSPSVDGQTNSDTIYSLLLLDFDLQAALMSPSDLNYFQSTDPDDRRSKPQVEVLRNYRTFLPRAILYNDGGFDVSEDGKTLCGCAELWLPFGVNSGAELIEREENERIALMERTFSEPNSSEQNGSPPHDNRESSNDDSGFHSPYSSPPRQGTLPSVGNCRTPPNPSRPDPTSPPSPPGRRWVPPIQRRSSSERNNNNGSSLPPRNRNGQTPLSGGRYVPHIVVVSLDNEFNALGENTLGKILEATPLESRSSSVTCVKFSPSAEFCLIGYGVREQGNNIPYHPVNSLYRVKGGMSHISTMLSENDDVNIARFHPHSGVGFVYGTKQGRVRVLSPRPWNYYYD